MKIYAIFGTEGSPGYLKQSMKLPKAWASKPVSEVLTLFVETYNKKHVDAPLEAEKYHLERPLGTTVFPAELIENALTDYCDVFVVEGVVKTVMTGKAAERAAKKAEEDAAARAAGGAESGGAGPKQVVEDKTWDVKVRVIKLDRGDQKIAKSIDDNWKVGDTVNVTGISPGATVGMLADRIGLIVGAHPKHQHLRPAGDKNVPIPGGLPATLALRDAMKAQHPMLARDFELAILVPKEVEEDLTLEVDDACVGAEAEDPPPLPDDDVMSVELSDDALAKQGELKQAAAEAADAGDAPGALEKYTEAIALGAPSALLLCKRAELLLKQLARPSAAARDASAALAINPDSCKALRLRGNARRRLGEYEGALEDLGQAQKIDFDEDVAAMLKFISARVTKMRKIELKEKKAAEEAAADAAAADTAADTAAADGEAAPS